jgi:aminoglycoside phosphotransferase
MTTQTHVPTDLLRAAAASPADAAPPDGLDTYIDPVAMQATLQAQLPWLAHGRLRLLSLQISNVRRNTSKARNPVRMSLCYELHVSDAFGVRSGKQTLHAQVFRHAADAAAAAQAQQANTHWVMPAYGDPWAHLPALNLLLWALPNDPGLPQLGKLMDRAHMVKFMPLTHAVMQSHMPLIELLRYEPQQRATLRYTVASWQNPEPHTLYAKTFRDHRAAAIHARFLYFWRLSQANAQAPLVAQPLGDDPITQTHWQAPAPGVPLTTLLTSPTAADLLAKVGHALALLHDAPLAPTPNAVPRSAAHWRTEVRRRQKKLTRVDATLATQARHVVDAIEACAAHPSTRALSLIHGDFHPDQIWVHNGRIVLFDFDEFTHGDPMEDVAEFVVKLQQLGAAPNLTQAFTEAYATAAPQRFDAHSLAWHLTVQSLLQAGRAFNYQKPGWQSVIALRMADSVTRADALHAMGVAP